MSVQGCESGWMRGKGSRQASGSATSAPRALCNLYNSPCLPFHMAPCVAVQDGRDCDGEALHPAGQQLSMAAGPKAFMTGWHAISVDEEVESAPGAPFKGEVPPAPLQTFVLVSVVFETAVNRKSMSKAIAPLAIGWALAGRVCCAVGLGRESSVLPQQCSASAMQRGCFLGIRSISVLLPPCANRLYSQVCRLLWARRPSANRR